jgi:hypothetical protein
VWAQQEQHEGRTKSMSFRGQYIYSYATPIARIVDSKDGEKVALITNERHSITTSSKHMPAVYRAVTHLPHYYVKSLASNEGWSNSRAVTDDAMHVTWPAIERMAQELGIA